ncbi:TetR/AcrR family transcriptional regulator [Amycolatopsis thermalba]|uniref:TetR/AcrR family transcriptional regulator n=1 Tax=Amycolatopsis thermalba TaxID=944492 RepID=A0ABY4NUM4_9PSEU|nr:MULTISPECIES: TetR/AcrR family transcriptional regulator [Amycolatopsis]UQS23767.1 TetR/AcrR family transcriptional regulator [Amycolatopsis thermalba]
MKAAARKTRPARGGRDDWRNFEPLDLTPLLAAALQAFYERGFYGTSVRDIARRVGQTVPSLYYHHENKEGVFVALLEKGTLEVAWRARAAVEDAGDRPDLQFVNMIEAVVLYMTHRVKLATLDVELRYLSAPNRRRYAAIRKEVEDLLVRVVTDGAVQGIFTVAQPAETARALLGMCQSIARWYHPTGPMAPEEVAQRYIDIALMTVGIHERPKHLEGVPGR